jgi:hypothetical protein
MLDKIGFTIVESSLILAAVTFTIIGALRVNKFILFLLVPIVGLALMCIDAIKDIK